MGVGIGDLGRKQVELRLVEFRDRTDAVVIALRGEVKGLLGVVQELAGDSQPVEGVLRVEPSRRCSKTILVWF